MTRKRETAAEVAAREARTAKKPRPSRRKVLSPDKLETPREVVSIPPDYAIVERKAGWLARFWALWR